MLFNSLQCFLNFVAQLAIECFLFLKKSPLNKFMIPQTQLKPNRFAQRNLFDAKKESLSKNFTEQLCMVEG